MRETGSTDKEKMSVLGMKNRRLEASRKSTNPRMTALFNIDMNGAMVRNTSKYTKYSKRPRPTVKLKMKIISDQNEAVGSTGTTKTHAYMN